MLELKAAAFYQATMEMARLRHVVAEKKGMKADADGTITIEILGPDSLLVRNIAPCYRSFGSPSGNPRHFPVPDGSR